MLPLDSPRWNELNSFFYEDVQEIVRCWWNSIGTDSEELIYDRDLFHLFLHAMTIKDLAYAIAPWLLAACKVANSPRAIRYLTHIAAIEWNRLCHGVYSGGTPGESPPAWLAADYFQTIQRAQLLVEQILREYQRGEERDYLWALWALSPALYGDAKLASARWKGDSNATS